MTISSFFQTERDKTRAANVRAALARIEAGEGGPQITVDLLNAVDAPHSICSPLTSIDDATSLAGRLHQDGGDLLATATRLRPATGCTPAHLARVVTTTALRVHLAKLERKQ